MTSNQLSLSTLTRGRIFIAPVEHLVRPKLAIFWRVRSRLGRARYRLRGSRVWRRCDRDGGRRAPTLLGSRMLESLLPLVSQCLGQRLCRRGSEGSGYRGVCSPAKVARGGAYESDELCRRSRCRKYWLTSMPRTGHQWFRSLCANLVVPGSRTSLRTRPHKRKIFRKRFYEKNRHSSTAL